MMHKDKVAQSRSSEAMQPGIGTGASLEEATLLRQELKAKDHVCAALGFPVAPFSQLLRRWRGNNCEKGGGYFSVRITRGGARSSLTPGYCQAIPDGIGLAWYQIALSVLRPNSG